VGGFLGQDGGASLWRREGVKRERGEKKEKKRNEKRKKEMKENRFFL
jgi:hypothetical protein